ncbi:MAG: hypothetical protein ABIQ75_09435, partial [Flavobacteriales bacterium]
LAHSDIALLSPFQESWALMFRVANRRSTLLSDVEAKLMLVLSDGEVGKERLSYFNLPLQMSGISYLPLTWTVVHPLNAESPMAGMSHKELELRRAEMILTIKGFDEVYMQPVITRMSYRWDEIVWGGRFTKAFSSKNGIMQLELERISEHTTEEAPEHLPS